MNKNKYFDRPIQVVYWNAENECWTGGIAYHNEIICGCCGGIFMIDELYDSMAGEMENPIHEYNHWCNISNGIIGGELPDSLKDEDEEVEDYPQYYFSNLSDKEG